MDDTPPVEQPSRYGNKAYRTWHEELSKISKKLLLSILPNNWQNDTTKMEITQTTTATPNANNNNDNSDQTTFSQKNQTTSISNDSKMEIESMSFKLFDINAFNLFS